MSTSQVRYIQVKKLPLKDRIQSYVWKDARVTTNKNEKQIEIRLIDMDEEQLQLIYNHCKDMLYNTNSKNIGRLIVLDQISKQLDYCRAELAKRWFCSLLDEKGNKIYNEESLLIDIREWMKNTNSDEHYLIKDFLTVPVEYQNIKIDDLQKACRDILGTFNHSKITLTFIYNIGVYFTQEEMKSIDNDLKEAGLNPDDFTLETKINNHIKVPLGLINAEIKINPKGLTMSEFRDMIMMKRIKGFRVSKYSSLTTSQLKTLANKVLYFLEDRTKHQVNNWKEIMIQIEEVAKYKKYILN